MVRPEQIELIKKFPGTKVTEPKLKPWGLLIAYVWDPAGVLLHFAERSKAESEFLARVAGHVSRFRRRRP